MFRGAQSTAELKEILQTRRATRVAIPWVNTIAADSAGKALYADISVVPNVPNSKVTPCGGALNNATFTALGLPTLDGSRSECRWNDDPDALQKGTFGPANMPKDVVERINRELAVIVKQPAFQERLTKLGMAVDFKPGAEFNAFLDEQTEKWRQLIPALGIPKVD